MLVLFQKTSARNFMVNFMVRFWIDYIKKSQMYAAQDEAILLINDVFTKNGIEIPFPIRTIMIPNQEKKFKE